MTDLAIEQVQGVKAMGWMFAAGFATPLLIYLLYIAASVWL